MVEIKCTNWKKEMERRLTRDHWEWSGGIFQKLYSASSNVLLCGHLRTCTHTHTRTHTKTHFCILYLTHCCWVVGMSNVASSKTSTGNEVRGTDSHLSFTFTANPSIYWPSLHIQKKHTHTGMHARTHTRHPIVTNWVILLVHCKGDWAWMGLQCWRAEYQTLITAQ